MQENKKKSTMFEIMGTEETVDFYAEELERIKKEFGLVFEYRVWKADVPNVDVWCDAQTMKRIAFELGLIECDAPVYY